MNGGAYHHDALRVPVGGLTAASAALPFDAGTTYLSNRHAITGASRNVLPAADRDVWLRCQECARTLVHGPISGRHYEFSAAQPVQAVDPRDADLLVGTRLFLYVNKPQSD